MPLSVFERAEFLKNAGWSGATISQVGEDWSQRQIFRIEKSARTAILIHGVHDNDPRAVPGHKLRDFLDIGRYLESIEVSVPKIYSYDLAHGLMLVEDFGNEDFSSLIEGSGPRARDMYRIAVQCLVHLYNKTEYVAVDLPDYTKSHVHKGRQRVIDWYVPAVLGRKNPDGLVDEYLGVWAEIERKLPRAPRRFLHGDFHPGNLMYLADRAGYRQVGLLDFQGAMMGPAPYDLVNLLEDARRIVPDETRGECLDLFSSQLSGESKEAFLAWYPVLAAQFHFRVIGQAIKLAVRDKKTRLMTLVPTLQTHILRDFEHPVLLPMKQWFDRLGVDFSVPFLPEIDRISGLIRSDAF
ncbi:MAG TPA: phosphotransferase [Alphaproteobacteria bacterium]|nr:phosphotransferase [Alphaproteobacteria bacterium]HNS43961.1 phosphotransferase [Alphaproteobacteria bacterium]